MEKSVKVFLKMLNFINIKKYFHILMTPFTKEHGVFLGGSAVAMLFPIISAPIVARLYSPEDFGVYAVFIALATILFSMSSLELRQVPMLEEKLKSGAHGVQLAISIIAFFCLFIFSLFLDGDSGNA